VADETVNAIMGTVSGVYETATDKAFNDVGLNINGVLPSGVLPTPPVTSPDI
jgi:hypothetical protein